MNIFVSTMTDTKDCLRLPVAENVEWLLPANARLFNLGRFEQRTIPFILHRPNYLEANTHQSAVMSVTGIFLWMQRYIHKLTGTSLLAITAEMAGYFLLDYVSQYAFATILAFLLFSVLPIHFATRESWTAARIRRCLAYIFKVYFFATLLYLVVCLPFAYSAFTAPYSRFNNSVTEMRECAYRFEESECSTKSSTIYGKVRGVDRECFALAMCLRQPMFLLQNFFFFQELLTTFFEGHSFEFFCFFTGIFVVWAMGSGWWDVPRVEDVTAPAAPGPGPGPDAGAGTAVLVPAIVVEPVVPQNGLGLVPEVGANLAPPAANGVASPPLFENGGNGEPPRAIPRPDAAHPNPLAQNPIHPDILVPGPPGEYREGRPMLPVGHEFDDEVINRRIQEAGSQAQQPAQQGDELSSDGTAGEGSAGEQNNPLPVEEDDDMNEILRDYIENQQEGRDGADAEIDRGSNANSWSGNSQGQFTHVPPGPQVELENDGDQEVQPDILPGDARFMAGALEEEIIQVELEDGRGQET